MAKATARKNIAKSLVEFRSIEGKSGRQYFLVKGHVRKADFFIAFSAVELKEAALDILGKPDTKESRTKFRANDLAREIWYGETKAGSAEK